MFSISTTLVFLAATLSVVAAPLPPPLVGDFRTNIVNVPRSTIHGSSMFFPFDEVPQAKSELHFKYHYQSVFS